ncbi:MAG: DUF2800 domain-containing protein [Candidatus Thiodiazotropha endolucinida]|nr:DUF2800 domain-containing protein [Candidatus Thiodiazotropha taylori]MCW4344853.1 DUF2800 domain-containing protein [Candidatus Thiodiazotropha endolucinida]
MKHSQFSPSQAARWLTCPGSVKAEKRYPDTTSEAARSGTISHALLEHCLISNIYDASSLEGEFLTCQPYGSYMVELDRATRVNEALRYINQRILEQPSLKLETEVKLDITTLEGETSAQVFGTADVVLYDRDNIEVIDYKDGNIIVDPNSPQLRLYALGALRQIDTVDDPRIICTIIQPRRLNQGYQSSHVSINMRSQPLLDWEKNTVKPAIHNALSETATFVIGTHCTYCKHLKNCTAHVANLDDFFDAISTETCKNSNLKSPPTEETFEISNEEISRVLEMRSGVEAYFTAVNEEAVRRLNDGQIIKNFKLKTRKSPLSWITTNEDIESIFTRKRLPKYVFTVSKLATPTQLKKALKSNRKLTDLQVKQIENVIEKYTDRKPGTPYLAFDKSSPTENEYDSPSNTDATVNMPACVL